MNTFGFGSIHSIGLKTLQYFWLYVWFCTPNFHVKMQYRARNSIGSLENIFKTSIKLQMFEKHTCMSINTSFDSYILWFSRNTRHNNGHIFIRVFNRSHKKIMDIQYKVNIMLMILFKADAYFIYKRSYKLPTDGFLHRLYGGLKFCTCANVDYYNKIDLY